MITVASTYPEHYQDGIPIDAVIEIEFNKELTTASLSSSYFRVFVLPDYQSSIAVEVTKDPDNANKVLLTPTIDMPKLGQFEVWVGGDADVTDATDQGVQSIDDEAMDQNFTFRFSTGTERNIDIITEVDFDDDDDDSDSSTTDIPTIILTKTIPKNNAFAVECSGYTSSIGMIDLFFDAPVVWQNIATGTPIVITTIPLDDIDAYVPTIEPHGAELEQGDVTIEYLPPSIMEHDSIRITLPTPFRCNSDISVDIEKEFVSISGAASAYYLDDDYSFEFRTILCPMFTTARAVKAQMRHSVSGLSDKIIDEYILAVSLDIIAMYFNGTYPTCYTTDRWVKKLATCLTVKKLTGSVLGGHVGIVRERTLGDLKIVYDSNALRESSAAVDECIYAAESNILSNGHSRHGVKSGNTNDYVGRRRDVFERNV